jgi:ribosomal protein S4
MKNAAERTQKKQKRKADESVLQAKREEMDKNKVFPSCLLSFEWFINSLKDLGRRQAVFLSPGSD